MGYYRCMEKIVSKLKLLHIILLLILPGYLPIYFILRVSGVMCIQHCKL